MEGQLVTAPRSEKIKTKQHLGMSPPGHATYVHTRISQKKLPQKITWRMPVSCYTICLLHFLDAWTMARIFSTMDGSDSWATIGLAIYSIQSELWLTWVWVLTAVMSPSWSSSPAKIFLKIRRIILPLRVLGRSGTICTVFGAAKGPMLRRTCMISSLRRASLDSWLSLRATNAATAWPVSSSATPTTAASATK